MEMEKKKGRRNGKLKWRFLGFSFANLQISNFKNSSITNYGCKTFTKRKSQHRHRESLTLYRVVFLTVPPTLYLKSLQFFTYRYFWAWNISKLDQVYYAWLIKWRVKRTKILKCWVPLLTTNFDFQCWLPMACWGNLSIVDQIWKTELTEWPTDWLSNMYPRDASASKMLIFGRVL